MGSAREVQEAQDRERAIEEKQAFERHQDEAETQRRSLEARIEVMQLRLKSLTSEMKASLTREELRQSRKSQERRHMRIARKAD